MGRAKILVDNLRKIKMCDEQTAKTSKPYNQVQTEEDYYKGQGLRALQTLKDQHLQKIIKIQAAIDTLERV